MRWGQRGKSDAQVPWRITGEGAFAGEAGPLPKQTEGNHLAPAERGPWPRVDLWWYVRLAELINHDIEGGQEGIRVDHGAAPLQDRDWSCTLVFGCLLKF